MQFPPERLFREYADALNRGDRGWLEYIFDPQISITLPYGAKLSGTRPVAEALLRVPPTGVAQGSPSDRPPAARSPEVTRAAQVATTEAPLVRRTLGRLEGEPVVVVWEADGDTWHPRSMETLAIGESPKAHGPRIRTVAEHPLPADPAALEASPPVDPLTPYVRDNTPAEIRPAPAEVAIGIHHAGTYFDSVVDPLYATLTAWLTAQSIPAIGPWLALFDDPTGYAGGALSFTIAIPVARTLADLPRATRRLTVVHPWLTSESWRGPAGEITVLAMPSVTVMAMRRAPWRSTGEFARLITNLRRAVAATGRPVRYPFREYYHDETPVSAGGPKPEWEVQMVLQ
jgi:hypothetical protein